MIHWYFDSDCVGCPQGCINCGRKDKRPALEYFECDSCGFEGDELYVDDESGDQLCEKCLIKRHTKDKIDGYNFRDFIK